MGIDSPPMIKWK